jgi:integrase
MATKSASVGRKIQHSFDVGDNKNYQAILFYHLLREFRIFSKVSGAGASSLNLLETDGTLLKEGDSNLANASLKLKEEKNLSSAALIIQPDPKLATATVRTLVSIRGSLLSYHYFTGAIFPRQLASSLKEYFISKTQGANDFASNLSLDVEDLLNLQTNFDADSSQFKFLTSTIKALQFFKKEITENDRPTNTVTELEFQPSIGDHHLSTLPESAIQSAIKTNNLLAYHLSQMEFTSRKQNSGINNLYGHYHPKELSFEIKNAYRIFSESPTEVGLCYLLCFFLRVHVSRLNMLTFKDEGRGIWLDVERGQLCWNRTTLIGSKNEESIVRVPLPVELVKAIQSKQSPEHTNLSQIFKTPLKQLRKEVKAYPWKISKSSHKPFLTRLYSAYGRYVLDVCHDENYAAAITADFSIGVTSNFNYAVLKADRINQICNRVYREFGFSGDFLNSLTEDVGSKMGLQSDQVIELIKTHLNNAISTHRLVHNRSKLKDLENAHKQIVSAVVILLAAFLGLRKAREYSLVNHTIDLNAGLALLNDKASTSYLSSRLVPLPSIVTEWLDFYKSWLQSLSGRLASMDKQLSEDIAPLTSKTCTFGRIPLLFYIDGRRVKSISSKHTSLFLKNTGFASNFGRHLIDKLIRDEAGSVLINAFSGRASPGQEAYGERSGLSVSHACQQLREILDSKVESLALPSPPSKPLKRFKLKQHRPLGYRSFSWKRVVHKKLAKYDERCPFHERTLLHRQYFEHIVEAWFSLQPTKNIGNLIISLVICDGVLHPEELACAVNALLSGTIYMVGKLFFVDVNTDTLGIRRLQLSAITIQFLSDLAQSINEPIKDIGLAVMPELTSLISGTPLSGLALNLNNFLEIARDFYSVSLPGPIREWLAGRQHCRTLYPIAFARHQLNLSEKMQETQSHFRQRSKLKGHSLIQDLLKQATNKQLERDSNDNRLRRLAKALEDQWQLFQNVHDLVLARYIHYLCTQCPAVEAATTVQKYYYIVKSLLVQVVESIDEEDDLLLVDWESAYKGGDFTSSENNLSAINYFFRLYGLPEISRMGADAAVVSRKYIDTPSNDEVERAILTLQNDQASLWLRQSATILRLMSYVPLRAEDVIHLRSIDVVSVEDDTCIVITHAAGGTKKSSNADRVIFLDQVNARALNRIKLQKLGVAPDTDREGLFKSPDSDQPFGGVDKLLNQIDLALKDVSGSAQLSPHSLRSKVLNSRYAELLKPQPNISNALQLRNCLYELSAEAGHADPNVTIKNYIHCFDTLRRQWVDYLVLDKYHPHPKFLSGFLGIRLDAATKKIQRNFEFSKLKINDESFRNRIEDFSKLLHNREPGELIGATDDKLHLTKLCRFLYYREKTAHFEDACLYAGISEKHAQNCEAAFQTMLGLRIHHQFELGLNLMSSADFKLMDGLSAYLNDLDVATYSKLSFVMRDLVEKKREWFIPEGGYEVISHLLIKPLSCVGIMIKLSVPSSDGINNHQRSKYYDAGYLNIALTEKNMFPRRGIISLTFYDKVTLVESNQVSKQVGLFLMALIMNYIIQSENV